MTDIQPLPPEMLAGGVEQFARELPVKSAQVEDHRGVAEYGPPEPPSAPQSASGTFSPPWAQSGPAAPPSVPPSAPGPHQNHTHRAAPQPQPVVGQAAVTEDDHGVQIGITFNQPSAPPPAQPEAGEDDPFGTERDLTIEERVEWLEEEVHKLAKRLQNTLEANNLWDGS